MKRMLIVTFALAATCFGCNPTAEVNAKYDAITGEKLPEKAGHLKDAKLEFKRIENSDVRMYVFRLEAEGHVYYSLGHTLVHSEACLCKTNKVERK